MALTHQRGDFIFKNGRIRFISAKPDECAFTRLCNEDNKIIINLNIKKHEKSNH